MEKKDIRWIQRFVNYRKALLKLSEAVDMDVYLMSDLEKEGLIQRFEYTFELGWKTLQDFVLERGYLGEKGKPMLIIDESSLHGLIDREEWRLMCKSRNTTSHHYDEETANEIVESIIHTFHELLVQLETRLQVERINQQKQG